MYSAPDIFFQTYNISLLSLYNKSLETANENIQRLSDGVSILNDNIALLNSAVKWPVVVYRQHALEREVKGVGMPISAGQSPADNDQHQLLSEETKKYLDVAKSIGKVAKSGVEWGVATEDIAEYAARLKPIVKGGNSLLDALEGARKFASATEKLLEVAAGAEIVAGALSAGEAASVAGPQAAVAAALSVLAISGVAAFLLKDSTGKSASSFLEEGVKNGNPYILNLQQSGKETHEMAVRARQGSQQEQGQRQRQLTNQLLHQKGDIYFDSDQAANDPVYIPSVVAAVDKSLAMKGNSRKGIVFEDAVDMRKFTQTFDPFNHYDKSVRPFVALSSSDLPLGEEPVGYRSYKQDKQSRTRSTVGGISKQLWEDAALQTVVDMYKLHNMQYVEEERVKQLKMYGNIPGYTEKSKKVWELFKKQVPELDKKKKAEAYAQRNSTHRAPHTADADTTINFNKSLIEHFTINVKDGGEGITDFKRKVEEVLIEILNSVNTIH